MDGRKIIPALDVTDINQAVSLVEKIGHHPYIYGFKIGFSLGLQYGLPKIVDSLGPLTDKPFIYDHQKAATDIPDTGNLFAKTLKNAGINEAILFPQAGPTTLKAWIKALQNVAMHVIVGGVMTHPTYLVSEGGFIKDEAVISMYKIAFENNVRSFVMPLTKPDIAKYMYEMASLTPECIFYSPGFGKQGGQAETFSFLKQHYLIIGRSLLQAEDPVAYCDHVEQEVRKA